MATVPMDPNDPGYQFNPQGDPSGDPSGNSSPISDALSSVGNTIVGWFGPRPPGPPIPGSPRAPFTGNPANATLPMGMPGRGMPLSQFGYVSPLIANTGPGGGFPITDALYGGGQMNAATPTAPGGTPMPPSAPGGGGYGGLGPAGWGNQPQQGPPAPPQTIPLTTTPGGGSGYGALGPSGWGYRPQQGPPAPPQNIPLGRTPPRHTVLQHPATSSFHRAQPRASTATPATSGVGSVLRFGAPGGRGGAQPQMVALPPSSLNVLNALFGGRRG